MKYRYQALAVQSYTGTTYWHKSKETIEEVYKYLDRYCRKECDIFIYRYEIEYESDSDPNVTQFTTKFGKEEWEGYWNAIGKIQLLETHLQYVPHPDNMLFKHKLIPSKFARADTVKVIGKPLTGSVIAVHPTYVSVYHHGKTLDEGESTDYKESELELLKKGVNHATSD